MIGLLVLLVSLAVVGVAGTVRELRRDRPAEIPRSRSVDPDLLPPGAGRPLV